MLTSDRVPTTSKKRRGSTTTNALLLLGAAFFIIAGIKAFFVGEVLPAAQNQAQGAFKVSGEQPNSAGTEGSTKIQPSATGALPPVAAGGADRAAERLAQLGNLDFEAKLAGLAYGEPTSVSGSKTWDWVQSFWDPTVDDKLAELKRNYAKEMAEIEKDYKVIRFPDNAAGLNGMILLPKDPNNKKVYLVPAGTNSLMDVLVDVGQSMPSSTTGEALANVGVGTILKSPAYTAEKTTTHVLNQLSKMQYDNALALARTLIANYGKENVTVIGHSLAGGIAAYIAGMTGVRGVGFNSAPLGEANLESIRKNGVPKSELKMTNVNAEGELVSGWVPTVTDSAPLVTPSRQIGEVITVEGKTKGATSVLTNHLLDNIDRTKPLRYEPKK